MVPGNVVVSEAYICQAIGFPTPLSITWEAEDESQGAIVEVSDELLGVEIITSIENDEIISELQLLQTTEFSSPVCVISSEFLPAVRQQRFLRLDPITGMYVNIQVPITCKNDICRISKCYYH